MLLHSSETWALKKDEDNANGSEGALVGLWNPASEGEESQRINQGANG